MPLACRFPHALVVWEALVPPGDSEIRGEVTRRAYPRGIYRAENWEKKNNVHQEVPGRFTQRLNKLVGK